MSDISQDDKTMGMIAHLSALVTIGPLVIWLMNKDNPAKEFVTRQAKTALNFVISLWIVMVPLSIVIAIIGHIPAVGWIIALLASLLMAAVGLAALVLVIMAAMKANNGEDGTYPLSLKLIP